MIQGRFAVLQPVGNGLPQHDGHAAYELRTQVSADGIAAQRQGQAARLRAPPHAQVGDQVQAVVLVGELAFVDEQPHVRATRRDVCHDLVEGHDDSLHVRLEQAEGQVGRGHQAGYGDGHTAHLGRRHRCPRHQPRSIALAHGCAVREQQVLVRDVSVGVDGDGRDLQLPRQRTPV